MTPDPSAVVLGRVKELLSKGQIDAVLGPGDRLITACPGAGKTRSISARAALLASRQQAVALTTYTNVAARAINAALERDFKTRLDDQHFIGTLHGLLLRYVFHPFGHLVMSCPTPPSVRVASSPDRLEVNGWLLDPDDFSFTPDGNLTFRGPQPEKYVKKADVAALAQSVALASKQAQAQAGLVTADDAMFWSLEALRMSFEAREALSKRFTEIIVDEAQDTSALQIACLEQLAELEQRPSLVLVGDFDQSIYGFQGASPQACLRLAETVGLEKVRLAENYRSSQLICNISALLRHVSLPDRAMGTNATLDLTPGIMLYAPADITRLPERFAQLVDERGFRLSDSAVVARGNLLVSQLAGAPSRQLRGTSRLLGLLLDLTSTRHSTLDRSKVRGLEELLAEIAFPTAVPGSEYLPGDRLRASLMSVIEALPEGDITLGEWRAGAVSAIKEASLALNPQLKLVADDLLPLSPTLADAPLNGFLPGLREDGLLVTTVHGVKGMSLDSVLLVADYEVAWNGREAERWSAYFRASLEGQTVHLDEEELRVLYVGVTRAERLLQLAVPDDTDRDALAALVAAGFHLSP